jgi:hypothetical protein
MAGQKEIWFLNLLPLKRTGLIHKTDGDRSTKDGIGFVAS